MAEVWFSQTITKNHRVQITVTKNTNKITAVKWHYIAGVGKCCSYVAGVLFKVQEANKKGYIGIACTDQSCVWKHKYTRKRSSSVENIKSFTDKSTFNKVTAFETDEHLKQHLTKLHMQALTLIPGTLMNNMLTTKPRTIPVTVREEPHNHGEHLQELLQCDPCKETFEHHIKVTPAPTETLATQTLSQNSALWTSQRRLHITNNSVASVPKKVDTDTWSRLRIMSIHPATTGDAWVLCTGEAPLQ